VVPLSILDPVPIAHGQAVGDAIAASVELARLAETCGYRRVWYAEHHNMATIGSSATSVLIANVAACTETIVLGHRGPAISVEPLAGGGLLSGGWAF